MYVQYVVIICHGNIDFRPFYEGVVYALQERRKKDGSIVARTPASSSFDNFVIFFGYVQPVQPCNLATRLQNPVRLQLRFSTLQLVGLLPLSCFFLPALDT